MACDFLGGPRRWNQNPEGCALARAGARPLEDLFSNRASSDSKVSVTTRKRVARRGSKTVCEVKEPDAFGIGQRAGDSLRFQEVHNLTDDITALSHVSVFTNNRFD